MNAVVDSCSEVLVVGGGLVGASLAIALSKAGIATTLVESRAASQALADPARERFLALSRTSVNALRALGVWPQVEPHAASINAVHVSRRGDFGRLLLRARDHDVDRFGAVVPASRLGQALEAALQRADRLTRLAPATVLRFTDDNDGVTATAATPGGECRLRASLLVGADGAESSIRAQAGLAVEGEAYGQDALIQSVGVSRDHHGVAYERFTDDGAIALLPLPDRRAGLVWTLPHERAGVVAELSGQRRLDALQDAFGHRLGRFGEPGHLVRMPLHRRFAGDIATGRVVIVGNAAQSLHPVAAQGFNLGLRDALVLAEELAAIAPVSGRAAAAASQAGAVAGGTTGIVPAKMIADALTRHRDRRRPDRERIAALSHSLARWPKVNAAGLRALRSVAFGAVNASPDVRESLVLAAMGFGSDMPALALEPAA